MLTQRGNESEGLTVVNLTHCCEKMLHDMKTASWYRQVPNVHNVCYHSDHFYSETWRSIFYCFHSAAVKVNGQAYLSRPVTICLIWLCNWSFPPPFLVIFRVWNNQLAKLKLPTPWSTVPLFFNLRWLWKCSQWEVRAWLFLRPTVIPLRSQSLPKPTPPSMAKSMALAKNTLMMTVVSM